MSKEIEQVQEIVKLDLNSMMQLSEGAMQNLVSKEACFFVGDQEYSVEVGVKILSYDEVVNFMRGKDPQKVLMADLTKMRVAASVFDLNTKKPLFNEKTAGKALPQLIEALHKVSDEVNDFSGKYLMQKLKKKSSGVSSSSTESAEKQ